MFISSTCECIVNNVKYKKVERLYTLLVKDKYVPLHRFKSGL